MKIEKLRFSRLDDSLRFCYGNEFEVTASYICKKIKEAEDISQLEPIGLILNEDDIDRKAGEMLKHIADHIEMDETGELKFEPDNSDSYSINYETLPVIIDVTKDDIVDGYECGGCGTSYFNYKECPVCGNPGLTEDYPPIWHKTFLKRKSYHSDEFSEYMLRRDVEEIKKTYPAYNYDNDFVLWIVIDLYDPFKIENVYGSINILKKDGSLIPVDTIIRNPYPNKRIYQISKKTKINKSWKRNLGIPIVFNSLEEIKEIDKFIIKWEIHSIVDSELLVDTIIVNHPFSIIKYCDDARKKFITVKLKDYSLESLLSFDSLANYKNYEKEFARACVLENDITVNEIESQDNIYSVFHDAINDSIYEGEIVSSEDLMSIKPNLNDVEMTIKDKNLSKTFTWRITFGMRYIRGILSYHRNSY